MSRVLNLLVAALLVVGVSPASGTGSDAGTQSQFDKLDALMGEFAAQEEKSKEYFLKIGSLRESYDQRDDFEVLLRERARVHVELNQMLADIGYIQDRYRHTQNNIHFSLFATGFDRRLASSGQRRTRGETARIIGYDGMFDKTKRLVTRIQRALREDDADVQVLFVRMERRSNLLKMGGVTVFVLCWAMVFIYWRRGQDGAPYPQARADPTAAGLSVVPVAAGGVRIVRELSRREGTVVYEGLDVELGRKVALKRIRGNAEKFLSQARLAASLRHPNLVEVYSILQEGDAVALVYEFVEGRTLQETLDEREKLSLAEALPVMRGICSVLDHAHAKNILHRDLNPGNVMLGTQGEVKVMNFGMAHYDKVQVARAARASSSGYTAPEQELGEVTKSSDLFSLGVCCYEVLTGRMPFPGPNYMAQKSERLYHPLSNVEPGLPVTLDGFIARALAPEAHKRFRSGAEFYTALEAAVKV